MSLFRICALKYLWGTMFPIYSPLVQKKNIFINMCVDREGGRADKTNVGKL